MNCDFCNRPMCGDCDRGFRCERCGATWNGVAGFPVRPGYTPAESAARFDAAESAQPDPMDAAYSRWVSATNDPNGNY